MRRIFYSTFLFAFLLSALTSCNSLSSHAKHPNDRVENRDEDEDEDEGYDGAAARDQFEFEQIKDPSLGYVPSDRMIKAVDYTESLKSNLSRSGRTSAMTWTERGPNYDSTGPSNGNYRGGTTNPFGTFTSGRTAAVLIDTLNDPTGNTAFLGGIAGGLWKCTNFLSAIPNWVHNNDRFDNLAISSICQDPSNAATLYFSTGEATSNADAVYGGGVYRSMDGGTTWTRLPATYGYIRNFKIACDAAGNVYLAARITTIPVVQTSGLLRSKDRGNTWENITPSTLTSSNANCTDIEISSTGKLHASFGYATSGTTNIIQYVNTATPATVTPSTWNTGTAATAIRSSGFYSLRLELATQADTLYGATENSGANVDSIYKSIDGGSTWTKQNTTALSTGILSGQGWYNVTLAINPSNSNEFLIGGLDAYRSVNGGVTIPTRVTYWVYGTGSTGPYVHADHHYMQWWNKGTESRIVIGCDGGIFYSNNGGTSWTDKNRNLAIKQFYAGAIHPAAGSNYLLAGAQDNGVHQLKNAGLSYSTEVTGGDGCFVHINQQNPSIQYGTYVYNQYRRSVDGGATWSSVNLSTTAGLFVNPFDYDDGQNILYADYATAAAPKQIVRWANANTSSATTVLSITALTTNVSGTSNNATAFKVSPYTKNRVFIGSNKGKVVRLDNASTVTSATVDANVTDISGAAFDTGYISCVNTGSTDNYLVATFSSYGVKHVWYSSNAGTSWTSIDGTTGAGGLPDMPVRWAIFDPQNNNKLILATEAGVYTTDAVNGASTVWTPDTGFPTVRTDMLKIRLSDNTIVAATHGRGLFTGVLTATPEVRFSAPFATLTETTAATTGCRNYKDYNIDVSIIAPPTGDATVKYSLKSGDSAVEGRDFDFTANGDFSNPVKQQTFTNGVVAGKFLTIRVYDDAEAEGPESFTITFNVSGTTNAIAGSFNSFTVTINDNDFGPILPTAIATNYQVGAIAYYLSYGSGTTAGSSPLDQRLASKRSQFLYTAAELLNTGLRAGIISNLQIPIARTGTSRGYANMTVKMGTTAVKNLIDGNQLNLIPTTVVKTPYTFTPAINSSYAFNTITFDTPFSWDGTSSIVVELCYNNGTADTTSTTVVDKTVGNYDGSASTQGNLIWQDNIDCSSAFDGNSANFSYFSQGLKPTVIFRETSTFGTLAATFADSTRTESFVTNSPTNDFYYYLTNGQILASFKNFSLFNYGCTQVIIDRAGSGVTSFWSNTDTTSFLMSKTFRVLPTTNSTSGSYEATFYFSAAEKQGWEAATKQNFSNIKVIKLPGQISSITPANPQTSSVQIITPSSVGSLGNMFFVTATFNTGFSGFGFGIPNGVLPISLLEFKGSLHGDNAFLEWTTSSEVNSKEFQIEKSYDGVNYHQFATVKAAGNSNAEHKYSLKDVELAVDVNYYRLKMTDIDNSSKYSNIVVLKNPKSSQIITVVNNPFNNYIDLRFLKTPKGKVTLKLSDVSGKQLQSVTLENGQVQSVYRLNIQSVISKGVYLLSAESEGTRYTITVIKQ